MTAREQQSHLNFGNVRRINNLPTSAANGQPVVHQQLYEFDPTRPPPIVDDFVGTSLESGEIGQLGWSFGGGVMFVPTIVAGHPGCVTRRTNAANTIATTFLASAVTAGASVFSDIAEICWIVRMGANFASAEVYHSCGLYLTTMAAINPNGIMLEGQAGEANWQFVARNGAETRINTGVARTASQWLNFRARRVSDTDWRLSLNGGAEVALTTNLPAGTGQVIVGNQINCTTATNRDLEIDYFAMRFNTLAR